MTVRAEGSFDPNLLVVTSGYLNDLLDVNDSGRVHGSIIVFDTGYGVSPGTWIIGTGGGAATGSLNSLSDVNVDTVSSGQILKYLGPVLGWSGATNTGTFISGANYLDELGDVNLSGPIYPGQIFLNNGSYWHQYSFGTTDLWNVTGHALVSQDHALVYQSNIGRYLSAHVLAAPTGLLSTDSDAQMSGNTDIIQARLNGDSGIVYIPTGTYRVNTLYVRGNHIHLFGPGRLLAQTGYNGDAVVVVSGNSCLIEDITIDGNGKSWSGVIGRGEGLAIVGDNNIVRNVHVYNTPSGGASNAIAVRFGDNNLIEGCYVSGAGHAAYYCNGDFNTFRNNTATHFRNRGFAFTGGPYNKLTIDGFYSDNPVSFYQLNNGGAPLEINPGTGTDQYIRNVDINRAIVGNGGSGGNCAQFAKTTNLNITNSVFYPRHSLGDTPGMYSSNLSTDVRFVEGIENLTISNSWVAGFINFDSIARNITITKTRFGEYMDNRSGNFGSGYSPASHIVDLMASGTITIHDCEFYGFSSHAIDLDSPPRDDYPISGYKMLDIQRCHFAGSGAGTLRDINMTSAGAINWSRRLRYFDNTREVIGGGGTAIITTSTWYPYFSPLNYSATEYSGNTVPTSTSTNWRAGDIIRPFSSLTTGGNIGWICTQSGAPGTWLPFGDVGNSMGQSYMSGVYDVTLSGISNTSLNTGIATQIQNLVNSLPDDSTLRFPPGKYWLNKTIHFNHKRKVNIIADGAKFYETPDRMWLNSGTFYFNQCTGIGWNGGSVSGAANFQYIMSIASGLELSGGAFLDLALDTQETRNVVPRVFNLEQCSDILINHCDAYSKYTYGYLYRCLNISFANSTFVGVHTGWINRLDQNLVAVGTGFAQKGDIDKESARTSYAFLVGKGRDLRISNFHTRDCGGFLVAGSSAFGGGQGPSNPEMILISNSSAKNSHDNAIYLSSVHKCKVQHFTSINDSGLPHAIDGIKARGSFIIFDNCYIEHAHHGFGFEGMGGSPTASDYWTLGQDPGWSSQGCIISNCHAVDIGTYGVFLDGDEDDGTNPRDVLIKDNYFYNCYLGPSGRIPTGYWIAGEATSDTSAVIAATDVYRVKVIGNTIENSGSLSADQAIFVGRQQLSDSYYITGCVISNNTILGAKIGITLKNLTYATVRENYGERIGFYNSGHVVYSGKPALINCNNVQNSRFIDNTVVPSGSALLLTVKPGSTWSNNIVKDNIGIVEIN